MYVCTVDPPSFETSHFVSCIEAVLFSEVEMYCISSFREFGSVLCREAQRVLYYKFHSVYAWDVSTWDLLVFSSNSYTTAI